MERTSFNDIRYEAKAGVAKLTIDRPHAYNAFTTRTVEELVSALDLAERDPTVGVVVLTGAGDKAFCAGGDVKEAAKSGGYDREMDYWHSKLHHCLRSLSKPSIAAVNGYAIGGGHILHLLCDLTIACEDAKFGQAGPRVGSFDAGFGAAFLARTVGEKKAREIWFLCRQYTASEALAMGLVNKVVPRSELEREVDQWCREILDKSPFALKFLKKAFNADTDHQWGFEEMAQNAVRLYWATEEAQEAKNAFSQKRAPDFSRFRE